MQSAKFLPNTTSVEDRGGFKIKCTDTANADSRLVTVQDIEIITAVFPKCNYSSNSSNCKSHPSNPSCFDKIICLTFLIYNLKS